jgi:hypothetical protein
VRIPKFFNCWCEEMLKDSKSYYRRPDLEDATIKINISKLRICFMRIKKTILNTFMRIKV